jgi:ankyrin repeat protein
MPRKWSSVAIVLIISLFLLSACSTAQQRARKELDQKGIQFTAEALVESASKGNGDAVKLLLTAGMNPNSANSDGKTALVVATLAGNETMVDQLLDARADVNAKTKDGQTPLMGAAVNGNTRIVNILLSRGADLNLKDSHGFTALMYADGANKSEARAVLFKAGAQDWHPGPLETPAKPIPLPKKS